MDIVTTSIIYKPLDEILPNPFQTREREDPEHVKNLAMSIVQHGLMQIPSARKVNNEYQLAFGHSRLAAFLQLANEYPGGGINSPWATMPLNIVELTDLQMFEQAVAENRDRKDLTPIEEAKAMQVYREKFGKTSAEIGELFHLSESAVRNKIRLLGLPDEVQEAMNNGIMTEGAGRALITFYALPLEIRKSWEDYDSNMTFGRRQPALTKMALAGEIGAEEISARLANVQERKSESLAAAWWKYDDELKSNDVRSLTCRSCELRKDSHCLDTTCFGEKKRIYINNYLYLANQVTPIQELEEDRRGYSEHTKLIESYFSRKPKEGDDKAAAIIAGGCDNLRLKFDDEKEVKKDAVHCIEGYPRAMIVCRNHNGACRCMTGYDIVNRQAAPAVQDQAPAPALTAEELRKAAANDMKEKRTENEMAVKLMDLAGKLMGNAAAEYNDRALVFLISASGVYSSVDLSKRFDEAVRIKAKSIFNTNLQYMSLSGWLTTANMVLEKCGLPQLSPEDAGCTLEEILARARPLFGMQEGVSVETAEVSGD